MYVSGGEKKAVERTFIDDDNSVVLALEEFNSSSVFFLSVKLPIQEEAWGIAEHPLGRYGSVGLNKSETRKA